jgi:hypothetical protein
MSFPASVQWVSNKFLDETTQRQFSLPAFSKNGTKAREQSALIMQKRQRLLLANAAAGDYFCRNLITLPQAGVARTHLSERNIAPATVREFALGYAPDSYFSGPTQWGDGSLVQHLQSLNFTSQEIVDAGLATITKAHFNETNLQHSHIMDRFRGRLMVPIFDPTGKSVIAFGGRVLDTPGKAASWSEVLEDEGGPSPPKKKKNDFKAAKYINSPESLVFHKKNVLFGLHGSKEAMATGEQDEGSQKRNEIVIVEGYFDAISLAAAGIRQVVASMGTALSIEQLDLAARTASSGHPGGGESFGTNSVFNVYSYYTNMIFLQDVLFYAWTMTMQERGQWNAFALVIFYCGLWRILRLKCWWRRFPTESRTQLSLLTNTMGKHFNKKYWTRLFPGAIGTWSESYRFVM